MLFEEFDCIPPELEPPEDDSSAIKVFLKEGRIGLMLEYPEELALPGFPEDPGLLKRPPPLPVEAVDDEPKLVKFELLPCLEIVEFVSSVKLVRLEEAPPDEDENWPPGPEGLNGEDE